MLEKKKLFFNFFFCQIKLQLSKAPTKLRPFGVSSDPISMLLFGLYSQAEVENEFQQSPRRKWLFSFKATITNLKYFLQSQISAKLSLSQLILTFAKSSVEGP